jgi:hypothetical protein
MAVDLAAEAKIVTQYVLNWETSTAADTAVLVRLDFVMPRENQRVGDEALQVILTLSQALQMAETLTKQALGALYAATGTAGQLSSSCGRPSAGA